MWADKLQGEHKAWLATRYVNQEPKVPLMGIIGEAGEVAHALLNEYKELKHGKNPRHQEHNAEVLDAIGDCVIYMCSWCNSHGVDQRLSKFDWRSVWSNTLVHPLDLGYHLMDAALECYRLEYVTQKLVHNLVCICGIRGVEIEAVVTSAWNQVKERVR